MKTIIFSIQHDKNPSRHTAKLLPWVLRLTCIVCVMSLLLSSCIGCTANPSADEVEAWKAALNDEIDALKESHKNAQSEIDALKESYQAAQAERDALKEKNETAQQEIDALKDSNETAQQEINWLKIANEAAKQKIEALKTGNEAAQQELDRLKEELQTLLDRLPPDEPTDRIKIYIDQGHNPSSFHNAGAEGNGLYEQDLTFTIGSLLAALLEEDGRFTVCLSRPTASTVLGTDYDSSLDARVQGAEDFGADYFISLHVNAHTEEPANGIEVLVAEQGSTSYTFGSSLLDGLIRSTNLYDRGVKLSPNLRVLKNTTMPAALLEMGFITNVGDATLLAEHPELFAQGIYAGILSYFELLPNETTIPSERR